MQNRKRQAPVGYKTIVNVITINGVPVYRYKEKTGTGWRSLWHIRGWGWYDNRADVVHDTRHEKRIPPN